MIQHLHLCSSLVSSVLWVWGRLVDRPSSVWVLLVICSGALYTSTQTGLSAIQLTHTRTIETPPTWVIYTLQNFQTKSPTSSLNTCSLSTPSIRRLGCTKCQSEIQPAMKSSCEKYTALTAILQGKFAGLYTDDQLELAPMFIYYT